MISVGSKTQAGSGDVTPADTDRSTSLAIPSSGEAVAVAAPPLPDEMPAVAGADVNDVLWQWVDDLRQGKTPAWAFALDSDGCLTIKRNGKLLETLDQNATMDLGYFMNGTEKLWGAL